MAKNLSFDLYLLAVASLMKKLAFILQCFTKPFDNSKNGQID